MDKKTAIVTGANVGIGYETAKGLAKQGFQVVLVCRDQAKGEAARAALIQETGQQDIHLLRCDLSSQASIRALSEQIHARFSRIDVLVNNAGIFVSELKLTEDDIELQWATNHLGYYLLTRLLLDLVLAAPAPRIVCVSSNGHYSGKIDFSDLSQKKGSYSGLKAYGQSKLGNVLLAKALARRLPAKVLVNALHPGVVRTDIGSRNSKGFVRFMWSLMKPLMITPEKGAATSLYLATSPDVKVSGRYFVNCKEKAPNPLADDVALADRLWKVSAEMVGLPVE
jgi:NAD(P)-dependent dehydrogenase (short-subunit alcohol dehydrogenase family)